MIIVLIRINDVNRLVSTLETIPNERQQHAILFFIAIEKRADMTCLAELRPSQRDGRRDLFHSSSSPNASAVAPRVSSQRSMSHPVGACLLYFGIGSAVLDRQQHNKRQRGQSLKETKTERASHSRRPIRRYGRYHRLIVSCLRLWCDHTCARHLSHQKPAWEGFCLERTHPDSSDDLKLTEK